MDGAKEAPAEYRTQPVKILFVADAQFVLRSYTIFFVIQKAIVNFTVVKPLFFTILPYVCNEYNESHQKAFCFLAFPSKRCMIGKEF